MHYYGDVSNLNAPYDSVSLQGGALGRPLGALTFEGKSLPDKGFAWREGSSATLELQYRLNPMLARMDKCPLLLDGALGPRSCGAMAWLNQEFSAGRFPEVPPNVSVCNSPPEALIMPSDCPGGEVQQAPPPATIEPPVKKSGIPLWVWGLGLGVIAIGAAIVLKNKK